MLKIIDGLRTAAAPDIAHADRSAGTVEGDAVDRLGFLELLALAETVAVDADTTLTVKVQESNAQASGFVDVVGAELTFSADDDNVAKVLSVDCARPERLRYLRVVGVVAGSGSAGYHVSTLRANPSNDVSQADNAVAV